MGDLARLVVSTKNGDSFGEAHLQSDEQSDGLNRVVTTIDVVTHEEVVSGWRLATNLEEFFQIVELTMNVTADGYRRIDFRNIGFLN